MFILPQKLSLERFINLCQSEEKIGLHRAAKQKILKIRQKIEKLIRRNEPVYGLNTGFGGLSDKSISPAQLKRLQKNLILSHACGVGKPLPSEISRGTLLLLINSLSKGYSGITLTTLKALIKIYNCGVAPWIPEKGSVGASGDLAPLAHLALILLGKGKAFYKNRLIGGREVLKMVGLKPLVLGPKEGLALINGTHTMASLLAFGVHRAKILSRSADIIAALSFIALKANPVLLEPAIHNLKPFAGQIKTAANLRRLIKRSHFSITDGKEAFGGNISKNRQIQDAYSLRCIPQVHGASKDVIAYAGNIVETEINSVTDNPLFIGGRFLSGGNFHGQSLAMAADFLAIAVSELSDISERRLDRLLNPLLNNLSPFLTKNSGLNSGLMITQYTAAALVSHNKILCHPAVVDSIPTSGQQEDHVSMGLTACLKLQEVLENTEKVLAVEMIAAAQALSLQKDLLVGLGIKSAYQTIRKFIPFLEEDRQLSLDIEKAACLIREKEIIKAVEKVIGKLDD